MISAEMLAMPAGRELDALVAEKAMGWKIGTDRIVRPDGTSFDAPEAGMPGDRVWGRYSIPNFSGDIIAAWEVAKMLVNRYDLFSLQANESCGNQLWKCSVSYNKECEMTVRFCDTAPLAICRVALLVTEETGG